MVRHLVRLRGLISTSVCLAVLLCFPTAGISLDEHKPIPNFESDIRPIFREYCFDCHGANPKLESDLDLRLVRFLWKGGQSGPAIDAQDPVDSRLLHLVRSGDMPPGEARVPADKVAIIEAWIKAGAPTLRPEPESIGPGIPISVEDRGYWAYQPIRRPGVPSHTTSARLSCATSIDEHLRAAMPEGLAFSPEADRLVLIKRAYFTLIGLPPSVKDLARWLGRPGDAWFDEMIDWLLDSPRYGERWARHWLDVAGYADSDGYTIADSDRPWAWKYRDYVIQSLNEDKPWDQFIIEQLAGDELAGPKNGEWTPRQVALLTATGFLRNAADGTGSGDNSPEARNKVIADTLKIVGNSLMGVSLNCAQCHDHRYDPISQLDYSAIRSVFEPAMDWQNWQVPSSRLVSLYTAEDREKADKTEQEAQVIAAERKAKQDEFMVQALNKELEKYDESLKALLRTAYMTPEKDRSAEQRDLLDKHPSVKITPGVLYQYLPKAAEELKKYDERIAAVRSTKPEEEFIRVLTEPVGHAPLAKLFHRGEYQQPLQDVAPAGLTVAALEGERVEFPVDDPSVPTTGRRFAFAKWLVSPNNPLLARVLVNRFWMHHFGRGIVETPGEYGKLGNRPTHPELLDWLASEFVERSWSLKQLHRSIMKSTAWRQQSSREGAKPEVDPGNRYYGRRSIQRLDAEIIRDRMLAVSERLNPQPFGPPIAIKEDETGQVIVDGTQTRRSVYIRVRRTQPVAMLQAFDAPVMEINCEYRPTSTVATQSLILLNGEFTLEQAGHLAERAIQLATKNRGESTTASIGNGIVAREGSFQSRDSPVDDRQHESYSSILVDQVRYAWELALCRPPRHDEMRIAIEFLSRQLGELRADSRTVPKGSTPERQVVVNICQMLLNSNEFLYVE